MSTNGNSMAANSPDREPYTSKCKYCVSVQLNKNNLVTVVKLGDTSGNLQCNLKAVTAGGTKQKSSVGQIASFWCSLRGPRIGTQ